MEAGVHLWNGRLKWRCWWSLYFVTTEGSIGCEYWKWRNLEQLSTILHNYTGTGLDSLKTYIKDVRMSIVKHFIKTPHSVKPEVLAVVLLKIILFWGKTVCQHASSWHSEKQQCLHIQDQAVEGEQPRLEIKAREGSQDIFIRLQAARHPNQWLEVSVLTLSVTLTPVSSHNDAAQSPTLPSHYAMNPPSAY